MWGKRKRLNQMVHGIIGDVKLLQGGKCGPWDWSFEVPVAAGTALQETVPSSWGPTKTK